MRNELGVSPYRWHIATNILCYNRFLLSVRYLSAVHYPNCSQQLLLRVLIQNASPSCSIENPWEMIGCVGLGVQFSPGSSLERMRRKLRRTNCIQMFAFQLYSALQYSSTITVFYKPSENWNLVSAVLLKSIGLSATQATNEIGFLLCFRHENEMYTNYKYVLLYRLHGPWTFTATITGITGNKIID